LRLDRQELAQEPIRARLHRLRLHLQRRHQRSNQVNVSGNIANLIGALNPTFGNTAVND
jgi:hypothetical protein